MNDVSLCTNCIKIIKMHKEEVEALKRLISTLLEQLKVLKGK